MAKSGYDRYLDFLAGRTGGFYTNICEAIACADQRNTNSLASIYPGLVQAHHLYSRVGLWEFIEMVKDNPLTMQHFSKEEIKAAIDEYVAKAKRNNINISEYELNERLKW